MSNYAKISPATSKSLLSNFKSYNVDQPWDVPPSAYCNNCVGTIAIYGAYTAAELIISSPFTPRTNLPGAILGVTNTLSPFNVVYVF